MTLEEDSLSSAAFLETVDGEISFFRSIMRARPVGIHRHFHVLSIQNAIHKDTGHLVSTDDIWEKIKACYDLDALEGLVSYKLFLKCEVLNFSRRK
jgi:MRG-binding protein